MMSDLKLAMTAFPEDRSKLKLKFQSKEMTRLVESGPAQLPLVVEHMNGNGAQPAWLPPSTEDINSTDDDNTSSSSSNN